MRVTAVIPVHNHELWVKDAIKSMVNQTRTPDKFAIVNNGSTDDSHKAVLSMISNYSKSSDANHTTIMGFIGNIPTWFYSTKEPLGPSTARNYGMEIFREETDVFALLDSDDMYEPTKIEKSLPYFQDENVGVVYSDYTTWNEKTGAKFREYKWPYSYAQLKQDCIINCDSLISKRAALSVGGFNASMRTCEDYHLWVRLLKQYVAIHIPESLVTIRVGQHSSTAQVDKAVWEENWRKVGQEIYG